MNDTYFITSGPGAVEQLRHYTSRHYTSVNAALLLRT
jgi:hypothetical protein